MVWDWRWISRHCGCWLERFAFPIVGRLFQVPYTFKVSQIR